MFGYPCERTKVIKHGSQAVFEADPGVSQQLHARYGLNGDEPVILFFGTLRPSKGIDILVSAFASVRATVAAKLLIVGYPTKRMDMASLESSINALALREAVILDTRYVPMEEVGAIQSLADIVVLPYRNATQSGALYLAYQFARPVVATAVGGLVEDVLHEKTGLVVPPEAPDDLASALIRLIEDRKLAAELGRNGHAFAERQHAWPTIAGDILVEYQAIAAAGAITGSTSDNNFQNRDKE
jgi:glycosyltransferase involved in cell wall biosynthesis